MGQLKDFKSSVIIVTPSYAKNLLAKNKGNRNIRQRTVKIYASDMKNGRWQLTPQGIIISKNGNLLDGQHRLSAVVMADVSVPMNVTYDVEEGSPLGAMLDVGIKRTDKDVLGVGTRTVATANYLIGIAKGSKNKAHSTSLTGEFLEAFEEVDYWCTLPFNTSVTGSCSLPACAFLADLKGVNPLFISERLRVIYDGDFDNFNDSDKACYKFLSRNRLGSGCMVRHDLACRFIGNFFDTKRKSFRANEKLFSECIDHMKEKARERGLSL